MMFIFHKARSPTQTLNALDEYLRTVKDEPVKWLARTVSGWGNEFSYDELAAVIQSGQLDELIDWQARWAQVVNDSLAPQWLSAIEAASAKATKGKTILSDSDWYVQSWIQNRGGELITQLSEESRRAVMNIILRGQGLSMAPRDVAKQVRPLIGLTARQAAANANYRDKVYQQFIDNGLSHAAATVKAEAAALKYAGKQHRYRAETIVITENAFAYNRGAHMGVSQSIANGLMGRCEMVWTTAGTNRVCSRCLALKDTVVGHTDESGVSIPPLHPRCRCAIIYREVEAPKALNKPKYETSNDELTPRNLAEAKVVAKRLNPIVGKYFTRKSKWSGLVTMSARNTNSKHPNCTIEIDVNDCPDEALLHELVHAHSTSYYSNEIYIANSAIEEASVQFLTQEIANAERIHLTGSGYDFWVENLREINREVGLYETDLKFAQRLLRVPMTFRIEWLYSRTRKELERKNASFEKTLKVSGLLSTLSWEALRNGLQGTGSADK